MTRPKHIPAKFPYRGKHKQTARYAGNPWYERPDGYVRCHHGKQDDGKVTYILQHVLEMEKKIGRPLFTDEKVHHKNGVRNDNRIENLELWSVMQPSGQRIEDKLKYAHEIIERYETHKGE